MRRRHLLLLLSAALPVLLRSAALPGLAYADEDDITGPQPVLPKQKLVIVTKDGKRHDFDVEIATTERQQEVGEMFRTNVPADSGMLFVWPASHDQPMWMKNTLVPLDMVFIEADGTIRAIAEDTVPHSLAPIDSHGPVLAVLELAGGITARLNITVGDKVLAQAFHDAG